MATGTRALESKPQSIGQRLTQIKTPHTYAIIFFVVLFCWVLTFLVPAGKFSTHTIEYKDANGSTKTRTVLQADTFRYDYALNTAAIAANLATLTNDSAKLTELGVDKAALDEFLKTDPKTWDQAALDDLGLTDPVLYGLYGEAIYDTSTKLHNTATVWGTDDYGGFGFLNYIFEGLVTGSKYGSAVGIVALILVVGGAFGVIMRTGAIDAGIFAFISKSRGLERYALPVFFFLFSLGGATFGMSEEVIPFAMVMVPFVIALGYDSITAVTVTFVASQIGNGVSWMSPFSVAIAQGIAGIPVLSAAGFRLGMWFVVTALGAGYMMWYAEKVRKSPEKSVMYEADGYFRNRVGQTSESEKKFGWGHKIILVEMLLVLIWIIWGVTEKGYYIPEIASQFFVMGLAAGITAVIFKLEGMTINEIASSFQKGVADLAGTAVVVGMAKGILLVLGGSDATVASTLNTVLHGIGVALNGIPPVIAAWSMYVFQTLFNVLVTSNSGQAALTMPIMAPLSDILGISRQIAVLAYQMGSGFCDAITPVSASLIGVLGVARVDWVKWFKYQIKFQGFLFAIGTIIIVIAVAINLQ